MGLRRFPKSQILTSVWQPEITDNTRIRTDGSPQICVVNKTETAEYFFSTTGKKVAGATESCSRRICQAPGLVENTGHINYYYGLIFFLKYRSAITFSIRIKENIA